MKILMFLDKFFPPDIRVEKEARTLLRAGHEVFLLCPNKGSMPSEELIEGVKVFRVHLPSDRFSRRWNSLYFRLFTVNRFWKKSLESVVERKQIEVLHIHDLPMVKTGLQVARAYNIPLIADLHENYPEAVKVWSTKKSWFGKLVPAIHRWENIEKTCVQHADKVITVVDEGKEHYVKDCGISPDKITVVMNVEDVAFFCSLPVEQDIVEKYNENFTLSYIGGFGPHRGIHTAISAMPKILREIPNALLLLVGTGGNEADLRELAREKGVEQCVVFTGQQPFSKVPSYVAASKICLIPHIASGHTNTTVPHKLFQAMAMGKPVVVSSAKPLERIVKETEAGLTYPSGDADALAESIVTIYRDANLATRMAEAGKEAAKDKYNWEKESQKLIALYKDLR